MTGRFGTSACLSSVSGRNRDESSPLPLCHKRRRCLPVPVPCRAPNVDRLPLFARLSSASASADSSLLLIRSANNEYVDGNEATMWVTCQPAPVVGRRRTTACVLFRYKPAAIPRRQISHSNLHRGRGFELTRCSIFSFRLLL